MFRIKIAVFSVLISGAVLITFGLFFLTVIGRVALDRMDREVLTLGESQLHVWHPKQHWEDFDRSLRAIYGPERWKDLIVHVIDADHRLLYRSPHWPAGISTAAFPGFDHNMVETGRAAAALPVRRSDGPVLQAPHRSRPSTTGRPLPLPADDAFGRPPPPPGRPDLPVHIKTPFFRTLEANGRVWRTGIMGNQHITILLGMDMAGFHEDEGRYRNAFLFSIPLALLILAGGGWLLAHRALKPVVSITRIAEKITAWGLDQRIPETGADAELLQLVKVINNMLDRLEKSFCQAVRFSADAAHELQTPLTILQGVLDDAVQDASGDAEQQRRYAGLLEEVQRLKSIVQKLLILARADADQLRLRLEPVDMSLMIEAAAEDAFTMGPGLKIEKRIRPGVTIPADPDLIRMVILDLTANAVKYNIDGGLIRFCLTVEGNHARLTIANTGALIPDAEKERIFERFHRLDRSRSRVPGTGLGLSLAREIVRAHRGTLHLDAAADNLNAFSLSLPCRG